MSASAQIVDALYATLRQRLSADPESSYVARLHHKGTDAILKKVAEEAGEVLLAAKNAGGTPPDSAEGRALVHELADLVFHLLVLMAHTDTAPEALFAELARRQGVSGIAEKAARGTGKQGG